MLERLDLPPTARRLDKTLTEYSKDHELSAEMTPVLEFLRREMVEAVTTLENDAIISRGRLVARVEPAAAAGT